MKKSLQFSLFVSALMAFAPACLAQGGPGGFTPSPQAQAGGAPAGQGGSSILGGTASWGSQGYQTQPGTQYDQLWTDRNMTSAYAIQPPSNTTTNRTQNGMPLNNAIFAQGSPLQPSTGVPGMSPPMQAPQNGNKLITQNGLMAAPIFNPGSSTFGGNSRSWSAGFPMDKGMTVYGHYYAPYGAASLPPVGTGTCTGAINITNQNGEYSYK